MRTRAAVFVLDDNNNVLLFHRRKYGAEYYAVPGGGVEPGETPEQAAVRELKEETSLDVTLGEKIGEIMLDGDPQHFYISRSWSGTPQLGGEEAERNSPENEYLLEWVPLAKLGEINLREKAQKLLFRSIGM